MAEWEFAAEKAEDQLAELHFYSMKKKEGEKEIEFLITVKEFANPKDFSLKFFALADKQTNQSTAPYTPSGWGPTLLKALAECVEAVHRFPYEG